MRAAVACGVGLFSVAGVAVPASIASAAPAAPAAPAKSSGVTIASTGLRPGAIKHVWLIILENKSYDATFTGLAPGETPDPLFNATLPTTGGGDTAAS